MLVSLLFRVIAAFMIAAQFGIADARAADVPVEKVARLVRQAETGVADPRGWAVDILDVLRLHGLDRDQENVCAVIAVVDQESGFVADPAVPGLGALSEKSLKEKLDRIPVAGRVALTWLENNPSPDTSFLSRIRSARTERDLDLTYRALVAQLGRKTGLGAALDFGLLNRAIEERNEIETAGSMQVSVKFALETARKRRWLPMLLDDIYAVRDELYTRHGGLYYGVAQLLTYETGYDRKVYRFADYNAGRYASRNAAFQTIVAELSGDKLALDGDLLSYAKNGKPLGATTQSERAIIKAAQKHLPDLTARDIRDDLLLEKQKDFAATPVFVGLRNAYGKVTGNKPPFAVIPEINLESPKITRIMSTQLFAETVNKRYAQCMKR
jgi:hypothetical protein